MFNFQQVYAQIFSRSHLLIQSGISIANGNVISELNPLNCGEPINVFVLANSEKDKYSGLLFNFLVFILVLSHVDKFKMI